MDKAVLRGLLAAAAAVVSFLFAWAGFLINVHGHHTPGSLLVDFLNSPGEHRSIFEMAALEFVVDFVFCFALMWALYWLFRRLGRQAGKSS